VSLVAPLCLPTALPLFFLLLRLADVLLTFHSSLQQCSSEQHGPVMVASLAWSLSLHDFTDQAFVHCPCPNLLAVPTLSGTGSSTPTPIKASTATKTSSTFITATTAKVCLCIFRKKNLQKLYRGHHGISIPIRSSTATSPDVLGPK
jgi:hypothetical protein